MGTRGLEEPQGCRKEVRAGAGPGCGGPSLSFTSAGALGHTEPKRNAIHPIYISAESLWQPRGEEAVVGQGRGDLLETPGVKVRGNAGMARGGSPASPEDWPDLRRT